MVNNIHTSVLLNELIEGLCIKPNGTYVDCTAGFGGHSQEILNKLSDKGSLICFDQDINAIKHLKEKFAKNKNVEIVKDNFANIDKHILKPVDGIIFDIGVSSLMLDDPKRGFSYKNGGPLDMRMDSDQKLTASDVLNDYSPQELTDVFHKYGEIDRCQKVISAIVEYRKTKKIETTNEFVEIIKNNIPPKELYKKKHPARVYFQALRIEVNDELNLLDQAIKKSMKLLKPKGCLAIITFHSLEDMIVKQAFVEASKDIDEYGNAAPISKITESQFKLFNKKPILPTEKEIETNYRSHSAKLRILIKKD